MNPLDPSFLFGYLPIVVTTFYVAGRLLGTRAATAIIVLATLIYCIPFGIPFLVLLLASTIINYWAFNYLLNDKPGKFRHRVFWLALLFNFSLLIIFKYNNLFSSFPGTQKYIDFLNVAVPVTLSFITFQRMVMVLEAYQREPGVLTFSKKSPGGTVRFSAFNLFFPSLLIGPITFASELGKQFDAKDFGKFKSVNIQVGLTLIIIGLVKKILIADPLATFAVNPLFTANALGQDILPVEAVAGMLAYYVQLYFDFSGYTNIAIGIARLFGLILPINFNSPLRASGIVDFYKRWHITLTRVIARLLFTPLSLIGTRFAARHRFKGSRAKFFGLWIPLMINFQVIGLWHGAQWTYLVFGLFHGLWYVLETEVMSTKKWKSFKKSSPKWLRLKLGQAIFFIPMLLSFTLFRCGSLGEFWSLLNNLGGDWTASLSSNPDSVIHGVTSAKYIFIAYLIVWLSPNAYEMMERYNPGISTYAVPSTTPKLLNIKWRPLWYMAIPFVVGVYFVINSLGEPIPFVYGGF